MHRGEAAGAQVFGQLAGTAPIRLDPIGGFLGNQSRGTHLTGHMQRAQMTRQPQAGRAGLLAHQKGFRVGLPVDPLGHALQAVGNRANIPGAVAPGASLSDDNRFGGHVESNESGILFHETPVLSEMFARHP